MTYLVRSHNRFTLVLLLCFISLSASMAQQDKKRLDRLAIKAMEGCFDVSFKYTETFAPEVDYEQAYDYTSGALEWAEIIEDSDDKIVLQHILVINDTMIIKHWRQDWIYESDRELHYIKDNQWEWLDLDAKKNTGKWTQIVYQVDDSPRYGGTATWTHVDDYSRWYTKADSPLPRREYSKRDDYNVLKRGNQVIIQKDGWIHEQDNDKIIRSNKGDVLLTQEKGYNTYHRVPNHKCNAGRKWWIDNEDKWKNIREVWDGIYFEHKQIRLADKINDKKLYEHLFFTEDDMSKVDVEKIINSYIVK